MTARTKAANEFLQNMANEMSANMPQSTLTAGEANKPAATTRAGLKHIGGYFDLDTVEKVAVLRARLRLDNSELIKLAVDELHRKHTAKRAFGDA